jgi:hypothetical protein
MVLNLDPKLVILGFMSIGVIAITSEFIDGYPSSHTDEVTYKFYHIFFFFNIVIILVALFFVSKTITN